MNIYKYFHIIFFLPAIIFSQVDKYSIITGGSFFLMTQSSVQSIESTSEFNFGYSINLGVRSEFESDNLISLGMQLGYEQTNFSFDYDDVILRKMFYKNHFITDQIFVKYNNLFSRFDIELGLQARFFFIGNLDINDSNKIETQTNPELLFNLNFAIEYIPEILNNKLFFQPFISIGLSDYSFGNHLFVLESNIYMIGLNMGYIFNY